MDKFKSSDISVGDRLDEDGFCIHNVMFTNRDLIQSILYISPFCWSVIQNKYNPTNINTFMITINREDEVIMLTPGRSTRIAAHSQQISEVLENNDTKVLTFVVSTGFLLDTFKFCRPKESNDGKYIVEETGDLIMFRDDFEDLMKVMC